MNTTLYINIIHVYYYKVFFNLKIIVMARQIIAIYVEKVSIA